MRVCAEAKPERLCVLSSLSVLMASAASLELFGMVSRQIRAAKPAGLHTTRPQKQTRGGSLRVSLNGDV